MPLPKINPTETKAWRKLQTHFSEIEAIEMRKFFEQDEDRVAQFSVDWQNFYVDYSKNRITRKTKALLLQLADEVGLQEAIRSQFDGDAINETESRAVLHTALRDFENMKPEVKESLKRMEGFSDKVISGTWKGYSNKQITDIVNIGIGGSDLGPSMVTKALYFYKTRLDVHFLSNVDGDHSAELLKTLDPETTLFIVVSKSFTTQETMTNANTVRQWFLGHASESGIAKHFVAVSTNLQAVRDFGIAETNIFTIWDWVGGRFSLWSAAGLSICCAVGFKNFKQLLAGAHEMDKHFTSSDFSKNIPVVLALLSVWYNNFFKVETEAMIPYTHYLDQLVPYLQQACMESNGKSVDRNGRAITYQTGNIIWGGTGTNAQHAFFQLLHQGTKMVPSDFICFTKSCHGNKEHHEKLLANCFAQTEALMLGGNQEKVDTPFKSFLGNKPSTTLLIDQLTPKSLGSLLALYEHKLFVQGIVWNIFSYDQWGVELGKKTAKKTFTALSTQNTSTLENPSTREYVRRVNKK